MTHPLSASRLNDFLGCAHQSALWLAGVSPVGPVDETLELVRSKGFEHEAQVLAGLEQLYGKATRIKVDDTLQDRAAATIAAINAGATLIYQGALMREPWLGFPDFLIRKTRANGTSTWEPEDAKLARKPKADHVLQLGIYAGLLEASLGLPVGNGAIHVPGGASQYFDLRQTRYILKRLVRKFEAFVGDEARATRPVPCGACAQCDYKSRCEAAWRAADSPFFVAGVAAAQAVKLEQGGVCTLAQLAALAPGTSIDGIGAEKLARLAAQARMQLQARRTGKHSFEVLPTVRGRGFSLLPAPDDGDLFFDMEGDPLLGEGLEYLFGLFGRLFRGSEEQFRAVWAHNQTEEKAAFETVMRLFVDHFAHHPEAHIYHYAQYEPNALKRLAMRYATMEAELDQMLRERRFVDLYRVAVQSIRASTESYSLKDLEMIYWGGREGEVKTAAASIVEYERWHVTRDDTILDAIALYNKSDCISTAHLRRWVESLRPPGCRYEIINDMADEKREKSAERAELEARKQDLAARVRSSMHGDARVRDLTAELLWFHQRTQKPGWWALFERQSWSEEELIEDPESLGALVLDPNTPVVPDKQSLETTYRFSPQDTKLKIRDTPKIAETIGYAGSIVDLVPEDGRIVLRRGIKSGPLPERFSLVPAPINMRDVPDAVMRFAERFASDQLQSDTALMDLLSRRPPRLRGRAAGAPVLGDGEELAEGAIRAVMDLDGSYLFVQGPPGTGKTYMISQVIAALLRAGHRVGVSSNSHKAIHKVLEDIEKRASETGLTFAGAKKGNKGDPDTEFQSLHITTVHNSEEVTAAHRLVGGTVFHFCRDDQRQVYDYLIVDEAGQVALGNLVAMAGAARNVVLVGDQMQLPQPVQGVHPGETGLSCLEYLLEEKATVPADRGILLNESRRLHPHLCRFISEAIYDGRLKSNPLTAERRLVLQAGAHSALKPAGLTFLSIAHEGCTQSSLEEAQEIEALLTDLLKHQVRRESGVVTPLTLRDILIIAPYNLQVNLLKQRLPAQAKIGTVDKFQGQEAAVVIVSMTTSRGADAPRGTDFLFNRNRFNVAVSRAQCLAVVVHGAHLLEGTWNRIDDLHRLNLFAHAEMFAETAA